MSKDQPHSAADVASRNPVVLAGEGSSFELEIVSYQFPQISKDRWDSNWLIIAGRVRLGARDWEFRDPCLTTFEVADLADWLDACVAGQPEFAYCAFTEPSLEFELVDESTIRLELAIEAAPPWAEHDEVLDGGYGVNIPVGPAIQEAANNLRKQLQQFPERAGGSSMNYQDEKLKAIGRLSIMSIVLTVLLIVSLKYPERTLSLIQHLPLSRHGDQYVIWLAVLVITAPICWAVNLGLIFTSPEQEVRFAKWSKRWRKTPAKFDEIEFDTRDPDYRKVAWRYFLDRSKR